jgi:hypothetical protein
MVNAMSLVETRPIVNADWAEEVAAELVNLADGVEFAGSPRELQEALEEIASRVAEALALLELE